MNASAIPILVTKLNVPPLHPATIQRTRLFDVLTAEPSARLVLLSAPAGFGKTTLLASWCQTLQADATKRVTWLTLDTEDNRPIRFVAHLIMAFAHAYPELAEFQQLLADEQPSHTLEPIIIQLINLISRISSQAVLILDDYHQIEAPAIHSAVAFLIENLPPQLHLVIASRADPPLPLARLRARRQLAEVRAGDLCFCYEETKQLLEATFGTTLTPNIIADIHAAVEGWPTGVQLLMLSLRTADCPSPLVSAGCAPIWETLPLSGQQHIFEYMAEEIFLQQDTDVQHFLLYTAIVERMSVPLCRALLAPEETSDASAPQAHATYADVVAILETLTHANLFIGPIDTNRDWFRYHTLFRSFLYERVCRQEPALLATLHSRACTWFRTHGMPEQALEHALLAGNTPQAADLLGQLAMPLIERGDYTLLHHWLDQIPAEVLAARPALNMWAAWSALLAGEIPLMHAPLERATLAWQAAGDTAHLGEVAHLQAHYARLCADGQATMNYARLALVRLPIHEHTLRAGSMLALGAGLLIHGEIQAAQSVLEDAYAACHEHNRLGMVITSMLLGDLARAQAQLPRAIAYYQEARTHAKEHTIWEYWLADACLGDSAREQNQLATAEQHLSQALAAAEASGVALYFVPAYLALGRTLAARGDLPAARHLFCHAREQASRLEAPALERWVAAIAARYALHTHDDQQVAAWRASLGEAGNDDSIFPLLVEQLTLVRVLLAEYRHTHNHTSIQQAQVLLESIRTRVCAAHHSEFAIEVHLLTALLAHARGQCIPAIRALEQALSLAEAGHYLRILLDEGSILAEPLEALIATHGPTAAYARRVLAALRHELEPGRAIYSNGIAGEDISQHQLIERLSEREISVLRLVAQGASNQEISRSLVISVGTVKSHLNHILGKLAAHNRTEAVARAHEFGLIDIGSSV